MSILSGPLVACICSSSICLIPIHNTIEQPLYWYEDVLTRLLFGTPILACQTVMLAEYWSNFSFEKKGSTYLAMIGLLYVVQFCWIIGYYFLWTMYLGYVPPMPMNQHFVGIISVIAIKIAMLFR